MNDITILYEDDDVVAVDKPAGLVVHGDGKHDYETVTDWFIEQYPDAQAVGEAPIETPHGLIRRPGVVHRLARDTSGGVLMAKTDRGHSHLKEQFQQRTVSKTYLALVYGLMKEDRYVVESPIARSKNFGRWTAIPKSQRGSARPAETTFTVLNRLEQGPGYSLVRAEPKTGRTHQIRVHLQYLNYPIVADPLYAGKRFQTNEAFPLDSGASRGEASVSDQLQLPNCGFERQALHAQSISFKNVHGEQIIVESPTPQEFLVLG